MQEARMSQIMGARKQVPGKVLWLNDFAYLAIFLLGIAGDATAWGADKAFLITPLVGSPVAVERVSVLRGVMTVSEEAKGLKLADVRKIEPIRAKKSGSAPPANAGAARCEVRLVGGSLLLAEKVSIADDSAKLTGTGVGDVEIAVEHLRSLRWVTGADAALAEQQEKTPSAELDTFVILVNGKGTAARGVLETLSDDEVSFQFEGESKKIARKELQAIVIAQASGEDDKGACEVLLGSGERVSGSLVSLDGEGAKLKVAGDQELQVGAANVAAVKMQSGRVVMLSELKPSSVVQRNIVAPARSWQVNRSVQGNPLRLGKESFVDGLGVSSYSALTFELDGKFERFAAVIGIDQETQGLGNCQFRVLGDGRELFAKSKRGNESGEAIELSVRGVKSLTLVVEPGEELDLADHADWCDARILKSAP